MKITKEVVVAGLKYIAENRYKSYRSITRGLRKACIFTWEDYNEQFSDKKPMSITEGMECGDLATGASIILNILDGFGSWEQVNYYYLNNDSSASVYTLIRVITGDDSYAKVSEGIVRHKENSN